MVGFLREKNASYLVFPKSLANFKDRRIVGIKYELIQTSGPVGRVIKPEAAPKGKSNRKIQPVEWKPAPPPEESHSAKHKRRFKVTIRFHATADVQESVEADSKAQAKQAALQRAVLPDFRRAAITRKVIKLARE